MEITTEQNLQMKNVLSYRGNLNKEGLEAKRDEINALIKEFGAHAIHPAITTSHGIEQTDNGPIIDMEILVPLDRDVSTEVIRKKAPGYRFKPVFQLVNAVRIHHTGGTNIEDSIKELYKYISVRNMHPITTLYNITINDPEDPKDLIVDLMMGIDPNIL
ncbi:MAG: hypothetical protein IKP88_17080 [Lachnospiraceae bacterium]|nr:hypothetical protein [Lachnospiraceae bacterium]